jgi:hypothetical protein
MPMDPMLTLPKNRKRLPIVRLCIVMGLTALLFLLVFNSFSVAMNAIEATGG